MCVCPLPIQILSPIRAWIGFKHIQILQFPLVCGKFTIRNSLRPFWPCKAGVYWVQWSSGIPRVYNEFFRPGKTGAFLRVLKIPRTSSPKCSLEPTSVSLCSLFSSHPCQGPGRIEGISFPGVKLSDGTWGWDSEAFSWDAVHSSLTSSPPGNSCLCPGPFNASLTRF